MPTSPDRITIRISQRPNLAVSSHPDSRFRFWTSLSQNSEILIHEKEFKLTTEFGEKLKDRLVNKLDKEIADVQRLTPLSDREPSNRSTIQLSLIEKRKLAASLVIAVKIESYSSLDISLDFGSIEKIAAIFDSNFEDFRVFLDVFVPLTFADMFGQEFASMMEYESNIPQSVERGFERWNFTVQQQRLMEMRRADPSPQPTPGPTVPPITTGGSEKSQALERAQWLWKLANGSLVVPVLLALVVLYFTAKENSSMRDAQVQAVKSIMEQQINSLKEDRERFNILAAMILKKASDDPQKLGNQSPTK